MGSQKTHPSVEKRLTCEPDRYEFCRNPKLQAGKEGGACYLDDAVLDQISGPIPPVISSVFPLNMIFVNPGDGITFNVSSPRGFAINNSAIQLVVNGVDVSGNLAISGSSSNKNVAYYGLQSNLTCTASITVTDTFNFTASASTYFETTWVGIEPVVYLWEALKTTIRITSCWCLLQASP